MGRLLSIDYGLKRTGLAVTDSLQLIANSLTTVSTEELEAYLDDYLGREAVDGLVVGLPKRPDGRPSDTLPHVEGFVRRFSKKHPGLPVEFYDERYTTCLAQQAVRQGGVKLKDRRNKSLYDAVSATIILQDYLESRRMRADFLSHNEQ